MFRHIRCRLNTLEHYAAWGSKMMECVDSRINDGAENFERGKSVRDQLQKVATKWNPDAKIYLAGSCVTLGVLEKDSDFDMCALIQDLVPDNRTQGKMCEKFWKAGRQHIPQHLRDHLLGLADCRTPVLTMHCINEEKVKPTRFGTLSPEEERLTRTVVLRLKTKKITETEVKEILSRVPGEVIRHSVTPYNATTGSGSNIEIEVGSTMTALETLSLLPDGKILPKSQREDLIRDFKDINFLPELLRFNWDCSFMGYSVKNSYLIRKYLLEEAPDYARYCAMAIKTWGKSNHIGYGAGGYMTTYAVSVMFLYFLLVTHNMKWIDPFSLPHPVYMPRYPDYVPMLNAPKPNPAEVGYIVAEFFRFYSTFNWDKEVVSLNRPRRSTREDVGWTFTAKETFSYNLCIEDPYEQQSHGGLNLGRWLHPEKFGIVKKEFHSAAENMTHMDPSKADQVFFGHKRPPIGQTNWSPGMRRLGAV
ncbi:RNA editing [Perkinsela sp. CCAP 1560/4]|nr:RNA editing [Perkinsela sp. CCAP 1560/4]|eukprot:KNH05614.1 RNA editing [Perkinsela sp. CCAP 1560/4]